MTQTDNRTEGTKRPRTVSYGLEAVDELPPETKRGRESKIRQNMAVIVKDKALHGKYHKLATYGKSGAASAQSNILKARHGATPDVDGWEIHARRIDEDSTGLFVKYVPNKKVAGRLEEHRKAVLEASDERAKRKANGERLKGRPTVEEAARKAAR
jgi:hypothetical protein